MHKRINRHSSRTSIRSTRSSHSVQTPLLSRKAVPLKPPLPDPTIFDETKEEAILQEAKLRKERAKKMRE